MSTMIVWMPIAGTPIHCSTGSTVYAALERAFGKFPLTLDMKAIPTLEGMNAVDHNPDQPYNQLIDAILAHECILVRAE